MTHWRGAGVIVLIAWGALAFGAVYPWAFIPLFAACAVVGILALTSRSGVNRNQMLVLVSLALVGIAVSFQLLPLPVHAIRWLSPETDAFLRRYEVGYEHASRHALSVNPIATRSALVAMMALAVLYAGLAGALKRVDTAQIVRGTAVLGAVMAIAALAQKAMWNGRIYGFWTPLEAASTPFGPFVNRNHFAGWMLMGLPLVIGYFFGRVARGMRGVKRDVRSRLIWFSSADASETILVAVAATVMAIALVLTMSRSGIISFVAALALSGWLVARRQATSSRRAVVAGYLLFVAVLTVGWIGLDGIIARLSDGDMMTADGRLGVWSDSWRLFERFPFFGTGLNTFSTAMLFYQSPGAKVHFEQAHNDYLQLLAEGGTLLAIPVVLAVTTLAWTVYRRLQEESVETTDYWIRAGAVIGIIAIALQETADFSLQIPGNAVFFVVLLAVAARPVTSESLSRARHQAIRSAADLPRDASSPLPGFSVRLADSMILPTTLPNARDAPVQTASAARIVKSDMPTVSATHTPT